MSSDLLKQKRLMKKFIEDYGSFYDEFELSFLKDNLEVVDYCNVPDILRQILCELNLLKEEDNVYLQFSNLVEDLFGLNKNIVEVGGGVIPSLSKIMSLRQEKGSITVYDPRLITELAPANLILKKEMFTMKSPVHDCDLFVGFMPRKASEVIIKKASSIKKDFIITLCGDGIVDEDDYYEDGEEFLHSVIYSARREVEENNMGTLEIAYLDNLGSSYPIIYNKRR